MPPAKKWSVTHGPLFAESLKENERVFSDLGKRLEKFLSVKVPNPFGHRYGKHDRRMTGDLAGFWHCHLRDDAVLIYSLVNRCIHLVYVAPHAELEGKRLRQTRERLAPCNPKVR